MSVEWPKKKDERIESNEGFYSMYRAEGWNACHDAFMVQINKGVDGLTKDGVCLVCGDKSQPELIPLDKEKVIHALIENEYGSQYTELSDFPIKTRQEIFHRARFICFTFGQTKEKLVATDNDCAGFVIAFEQRMLQKTNQGLRGEERGYLQSMVKNFCSKFSIPPQPEEVTVEEWQELVHKHGNQNSHYSNKIAQAIHARIKDRNTK